jgi:hypothetical protein
VKKWQWLGWPLQNSCCWPAAALVPLVLLLRVLLLLTKLTVMVLEVGVLLLLLLHTPAHEPAHQIHAAPAGRVP